jgi:uncharacterized protein YbjT (DUF2867 family)
VKVLVTGATAEIGQQVIRVLRRWEVPVRAGVTTTAAADELPSDVDPAILDVLDPATWRAAVAGCTAMFLGHPASFRDPRRLVQAFIDTARDRGVSQVVYLSVIGAGANHLLPHHAIEAHLNYRPGRWTILRAGVFAQHLGSAYRDDIVADDRIYVPAGDGRVAFVDARDVAEVAGLSFVDPGRHAGRAYTLTGPERRSFSDVAGILSDVLGRRIRYVPASIPGYALHLRRRGLDGGRIAVQTLAHAVLRRARSAVDPTLAELLGWPGHTIHDYVVDHAALWAKPAPIRDVASTAMPSHRQMIH